MTNKIPIPENKLNELYITNGLSTYEISKSFKCNPTVIQKRLKEYGIKVRKPKVKIKISKDLLKQLYINRKLSTYKIAKKLGIGRTTIYNKLLMMDIATRPKKMVKINRNKLLHLYRIRKLSLSQIGNIYNCTPACILKKLRECKIETRNKYEANIKYKRKEFDGSNVIKAYMIGFRLGDLNVSMHDRNSNSIRLNTSTTRKEQIELIRNLFGKYGHFYCKWIGKSYTITFNLDRSFDFLIEKKDRIDDWILKNDKYFMAFLGGYTDAEGNIGIYNNMARYRIGSYDKKILFSIHRRLKNYGMNAKIKLETKRGKHGNRIHNGDFWRVSLNNKSNLSKFFKLIKPYIKHRKRYNDLVTAEKNIIERDKLFH